MAFRPATLADLDTLLPLMRAFCAEDEHPFETGAVRGALAGLLDDPGRGRAFMTSDAGVAVGYLVVCFGYSLEFRGRDAFVDELYVAPARRGRGPGHGGPADRPGLLPGGRRARAAPRGATRERGRAARVSERGFVERPHYLMTKSSDKILHAHGRLPNRGHRLRPHGPGHRLRRRRLRGFGTVLHDVSRAALDKALAQIGAGPRRGGGAGQAHGRAGGAPPVRGSCPPPTSSGGGRPPTS